MDCIDSFVIAVPRFAKTKAAILVTGATGGVGRATYAEALPVGR